MQTLLLTLVSSVVVVCTGDVTEQVKALEGARVRLTEGDCTLRNVTFCRPTDLIGEGPTRTRLHVPTGTTAIRYARCSGASSARSRVADLSIRSPGLVTTGTPSYGLAIGSRVVVERVLVDGFVQGIRIEGRARSQGTNANAWRLHDVVASHAQHAGIFIDGGDTNVGLADGVEVVGNCARASRWARRLGPCGGFYDSSFLGSTSIAVLGDLQRDRDTGIFHPAQVFEGDSQHSVCLGCYNEGSTPSRSARYSSYLGGLVNIEGPGLRLSGPYASGLELSNLAEVPVRVRLGNRAARNTFLELTTPSFPTLRLKLRPGTGSSPSLLQVDLNNLLSAVVSRISADGTVTLKLLDTRN